MQKGAIQLLHNVVRSGGGCKGKRVTKVYGSTLLGITMGWMDVKYPGKQCYVTPEWPQKQPVVKYNKCV